MLLSLWRRLCKRSPVSCRGKELSKIRHLGLRPTLEALEDRALPAPLAYGILPPSPQAFGMAAPALVATNQMWVPVLQSSPASVIDLDPLFARMSGVHPGDGLQMSLMGNTNPGLVKSDLSEGELTLRYTPSQWGMATVTVGATDAGGACMREVILVTVMPFSATMPKG